MTLKSIVIAGTIAVTMNTMAQSPANSISTVTGSGRQVTVTAMTPTILKVTNAPADMALPDSRLTVRPTAVAGEAGVLTSSTYSILTSDIRRPLTAALAHNSGSVVITLPDGEMIVDQGRRDVTDGLLSLSLTVPPGGLWLGGGERGHSLDLTGDTLVMFNRPTYGYGAGDDRINQMNITMPLIVSTNGYALLFDDYAAATLTLDNQITYTTESNVPVTYYVIVPAQNGTGEQTVSDIMPQLTDLIGRQPLPPVWSLGYINSKYGYKSPDETLEAVATLRRGGYPLDAVVLDLYWFGKEEDMGRLEWDTEMWPEYNQMLNTLRSDDVQVITVSEPYILRNGRGIDNYNFMAENSMLVPDSLGRPGEVRIWVGEGGIMDMSNPATRSWLKDLYRNMHREGVTAFWGDLGEPEMHPDSLVHHNGLPARLYHNIYGNDWASIISEMMQESFPDERYMILMRGGTVGLHRYGVMPWSGDVSRSWEGLQAQMPIMINSALSGLSYMSHDVGGFAVDPANPIDPELYVRWLQTGLYTPVLRTHAQEYAEPFNYPELEDNILRPIIRERYRWLPYNMALAASNSETGTAIVAPIVAVTDGDCEESVVRDQYMWGKDVMIAPVLYQGMTERDVYFPQGSVWYDFDVPTMIYQPGETVTVDAPLARLPRFVRAGAIIPTADYDMASTANLRGDTYTLNVYPVSDSTSAGTLRLYDRNYDKVTLDYSIIDNQRTMGLSFVNAENKPLDLTVKVYGFKSKPRKVVAQPGTKVKFTYNKSLGEVTMHLSGSHTADAVDLTIYK